MQSAFSLDFNIVTIIFLLLILWCVENRLQSIQSKVDRIYERITRNEQRFARKG